MDKIQIWKEVPGFKAYEANIKGEVRKVRERREKDGSITQITKYLRPRAINKYMAYTLVSTSKKKRTVYVHQIIASCFIEQPDHGTTSTIVVHLDGNKSNNSIDNLSWKTFSTFMKEQFTSGKRSNKDLWKTRIAKYGPMGGTKPPGRKVELSHGQIVHIHRLYNRKREKYTLKMLADKYGCSPSHIYNVLKRREREIDHQQKEEYLNS